MTKNPSAQEPFLNGLRREKIPVTLYLVNGVKLQGQVEGFDQFVILLKNRGTQLVFKHAISTISPTRKPNISLEGQSDNTPEIADPFAE